MDGTCSTYGGEERCLLGRLKHRWEDNIKIDLQEVECEAWTGAGSG